jgi:predicted Abi (CAAX) family protease
VACIYNAVEINVVAFKKTNNLVEALCPLIFASFAGLMLYYEACLIISGQSTNYCTDRCSQARGVLERFIFPEAYIRSLCVYIGFAFASKETRINWVGLAASVLGVCCIVITLVCCIIYMKAGSRSAATFFKPFSVLCCALTFHLFLQAIRVSPFSIVRILVFSYSIFVFLVDAYRGIELPSVMGSVWLVLT